MPYSLKGAMLAAYISLGMSGCATSAQNTEVKTAKVVQESQGLEAAVEAVVMIVAQPDFKEMSAGALLEWAMTQFGNQNFEGAVDGYTHAIGTGRLNNAGRALSYWHIHLANLNLDKKDDGYDALNSFITVGNEVLDVRNQQRYAVTDAGDFVDRFDLDGKMGYAHATLNAVWVNRTQYFGRSVNDPVTVGSERELEIFIRQLNDCKGGNATREDVSEGVEKVIVNCPDGSEDEVYIFMEHTNN